MRKATQVSPQSCFAVWQTGAFTMEPSWGLGTLESLAKLKLELPAAEATAGALELSLNLGLGLGLAEPVPKAVWA